MTSLLSRVMTRAKRNWNATILNPPAFPAHKLPERKRPIREITISEDIALDQVESADFADLRRFAEITGLRRKELLLTWPQVDFEKSEIRIIAKGGKPRTLPYPATPMPFFGLGADTTRCGCSRSLRSVTRVCPKTKQKFIKGQRYRMTYYGIGTNRRRKWPKVGVDARLHDTRHTTGMRTLRTTGNLKLVQRTARNSG